MSDDVDEAVHVHLARMPDSTRPLLDPHIRADAPDAWLGEALMAYLRYWQTFAEKGPGGWYQQDNPDWPDGLYCVAERYPEPLGENRSFQVSLLGHEAQHVADHRAHPGILVRGARVSGHTQPTRSSAACASGSSTARWMGPTGTRSRTPRSAVMRRRSSTRIRPG